MRLLCLRCSVVTEVGPDDHPTGCPSCGDHSGTPANADDTVTITITKHELRVLTMWAERWGQKCAESDPGSGRIVYGICDRIGQQVPDLVLTFAGEIGQLREHFGQDNVEVHGFTEPPMEPGDDHA